MSLRHSIGLCLGKRGILGNLVRRQTRGCFHPAAEVEEGRECSDFPDFSLIPTALPQHRDVVFVHKARRLRELAGVTEQFSGLGVQIVFGPRGSELMVKVLIAGQAANCRRMETQSRSPTYLAINHRSQHLALESAER